MRVKILQEFRDKYNPSRIYEVGAVVDFTDEARVAELTARKLVEAAEVKAEPMEKAKESPAPEAKAEPKKTTKKK